jgi:hypothetical protein
MNNIAGSALNNKSCSRRVNILISRSVLCRQTGLPDGLRKPLFGRSERQSNSIRGEAYKTVRTPQDIAPVNFYSYDLSHL